MSWLGYFVDAPTTLPKLHYILLVVKSGTLDSNVQLDDIYGAVHLFEYHFFGIPIRIFSTDDVSGFRTVVAPRGARAAIAEIAMDALVQRGVQIAVVSYESEERAVTAPRLETRNIEWARRTRPYSKSMRLMHTFEETLATLGKSTRFNLRYYRRRLSAAFPVEFVADARGMLREDEVETLNRGSLNPDTRDQLLAQYRACSLPGGFLLGLRTVEGKWLSLIGGWRQGDVTVLHWQMNASGYEKLSIGTAMRSYFLEHEVERGARSLMFYGGTPHSIQNAFVPEEVTDLFVRQRSWQARALRVVAKLFAVPRWFMRGPNFLARAICRENLQWHANDATTAGALHAKPSAVQD
jgi:hypothetical protein